MRADDSEDPRHATHRPGAAPRDHTRAGATIPLPYFEAEARLREAHGDDLVVLLDWQGELHPATFDDHAMLEPVAGPRPWPTRRASELAAALIDGAIVGTVAIVAEDDEADGATIARTWTRKVAR